jgi:hypothetical protein
LALKAEPTKDEAEIFLYIGIVTDTGRFQTVKYYFKFSFCCGKVASVRECNPIKYVKNFS